MCVQKCSGHLNDAMFSFSEFETFSFCRDPLYFKIFYLSFLLFMEKYCTWPCYSEVTQVVLFNYFPFVRSIVLGEITIPQHNWKHVSTSFTETQIHTTISSQLANHHHYSWNSSVNEVTSLNNHVCIWKTSFTEKYFYAFLKWPKLAKLP